MRTPATKDPYLHAANVERMLRDVSRHLDEEVGDVDDERARELFDTTTRVLEGLIRSYEDYQRSAGGLWRDGLPAEPVT
jgi:hypothetical protein